MNRTIRKSTIFFVLGLVVVGGLVGACSGGGASSGVSAATTQTSNVRATTTQTGNVSAAATTVNVTMTEMSFSLDPMPTKAGQITFVVTNHGKIKHNFVLEANGREYATQKIPPGGSETFTVDLGPGTYNFVCTVFGHNLAGMQGSFTLA
ncbi:MAG: cupredoxin domain-containing protein [Anaerolineae bacterium]|nr:cupredoxin domain-containing protein [Anaerolineae bacterium]